MRKIRKSAAAIALSLAMGLTAIGIPGEPVMEVHAEVTPDSSISLSDVSTVTADTADAGKSVTLDITVNGKQAQSK